MVVPLLPLELARMMQGYYGSFGTYASEMKERWQDGSSAGVVSSATHL